MGMYEQIARNKRRTFVMLAAFVLLIALVAVALGILFQAGVAIVPIAIVIAIGLAWTSYFYSDKVALAASRAKPADGPEYRRYHNLVEGLFIAAGLPKPRLYVVDDPAPNAFATGRNPKHAALAVTTGLLEKMNRVELEGRPRPRAEPREELRHPRVDGRGHRGRRGRAHGRPRHAVPLVRRALEPPGQQRLRPARADPRRARVRAADPRARSRPSSCSSR